VKTVSSVESNGTLSDRVRKRYLLFLRFGNFLKSSISKVCGESYENYVRMCMTAKLSNVVEAIVISLNKDYEEIYDTLKRIYKFFMKNVGVEFAFFEDEVEKSELIARGYQVIEDYFFPENVIKALYEKGKLTESHVIYLKKFSPSLGGRLEKKEKAGIEEVYSAGENLFKAIVSSAIMQNASDIHVLPQGNNYYVFSEYTDNS